MKTEEGPQSWAVCTASSMSEGFLGAESTCSRFSILCPASPALYRAIYCSSITSKRAPLPHLLGRKGSHQFALWRENREGVGLSRHGRILLLPLLTQASLAREEQEDLNPSPRRLALPSQGSQACRLQPAQLPTPHLLSQPRVQARPPGGQTEDQMGYKGSPASPSD